MSKFTGDDRLMPFVNFSRSHLLYCIYGRMRKAYLEEHRPGLYTCLILSGKLYEHLAETDQVCRDRMERTIAWITDTEGINEELKTRDQLAWVGRMNSIQQQSEEIILQELVYA